MSRLKGVELLKYSFFRNRIFLFFILSGIVGVHLILSPLSFSGRRLSKIAENRAALRGIKSSDLSEIPAEVFAEKKFYSCFQDKQLSNTQRGNYVYSNGHINCITPPIGTIAKVVSKLKAIFSQRSNRVTPELPKIDELGVCVNDSFVNKPLVSEIIIKKLKRTPPENWENSLLLLDEVGLNCPDLSIDLRKFLDGFKSGEVEKIINNLANSHLDAQIRLINKFNSMSPVMIKRVLKEISLIDCKKE